MLTFWSLDSLLSQHKSWNWFCVSRFPLIVLQNGRLRVSVEQLQRNWVVVWQLLLLVLEWYIQKCSSHALAVQQMSTKSLISGNFFYLFFMQVSVSNAYLFHLSYAVCSSESLSSTFSWHSMAFVFDRLIWNNKVSRYGILNPVGSTFLVAVNMLWLL